MSNGTFTVSRAEFYRKMRNGEIGFDNEYLTASVTDEDAFRFGWMWSWLRMRWVPFDLYADESAKLE